MSRGKSRTRHKKLEANIASLRSIFKNYGLEVSQYSHSPVHFRVFGKVIVDYWPSTGRIWITGTNEPTRIVEPQEVCEVASGNTDYVPQGEILNQEMVR